MDSVKSWIDTDEVQRLANMLEEVKGNDQILTVESAEAAYGASFIGFDPSSESTKPQLESQNTSPEEHSISKGNPIKEPLPEKATQQKTDVSTTLKNREPVKEPQSQHTPNELNTDTPSETKDKQANANVSKSAPKKTNSKDTPQSISRDSITPLQNPFKNDQAQEQQRTNPLSEELKAQVPQPYPFAREEQPAEPKKEEPENSFPLEPENPVQPQKEPTTPTASTAPTTPVRPVKQTTQITTKEPPSSGPPFLSPFRIDQGETTSKEDLLALSSVHAEKETPNSPAKSAIEHQPTSPFQEVGTLSEQEQKHLPIARFAEQPPPLASHTVNNVQAPENSPEVASAPENRNEQGDEKPFLERLEEFGTFLKKETTTQKFFILDREGKILIDEIHSPKLQTISRSLARHTIALQRKNQSGDYPSAHIKIGEQLFLEVIPTKSKYGNLILGCLLSQRMKVKEARAIAEKLLHTADQGADYESPFPL